MKLNRNLNHLFFVTITLFLKTRNLLFSPSLRQTERGGDPVANIQDAGEEEAAEAAADDTDQRSKEGLPWALALQQQHLEIRRQDR